MAFILNIETATPLCSVALALNGKVVAQRETLEEKSHASRLTVFIDEILKENNIGIADLDAIAVGKGPGSYTGLRIGISTAKGLCYGSGIPLLAVNTLYILYKQVLSNRDPLLENLLQDSDTLFCPMIDARRMEVFSCILDSKGIEIESVAARIIDAMSFQQYIQDHNIIFFGSGMEKCREVLSHPNAWFLKNVYPHASALAIVAEEKFNQQAFENIAYFEPFYLKDFIATVPKKSFQV